MATKILADTDTAQTLSNKTLDGTTSVANLPLNVKTYGAVGDGVTSDQSAITNAVAAAFSTGNLLYWPPGTYVTTASIANFHSARHMGPGILKRGSALFYVDPAMYPGQINNLYVATTGVDTNDGLSSSQPRLTVQSMANVIFNYPYGDVTWKVQIAAGTYVASTLFLKAFPSPNRIQFLGAPVSDGTVPTTIFNSPGGVGQSGLTFFSYGNIYVEDIKLTNYKDSGSVTYSGGGYGIQAHDMCNIYLRNCHASTCDNGINAQLGTRIRMQAGLVDACAIGVGMFSNVGYSIGYNGTAADATGGTGVAVTNCITGVLLHEMTSGHMDYCYLGSNTTGLLLTIGSRTLLAGSTVISNTKGVVADNLSNLAQDPSNPNTYTGNTTNVTTLSGAMRSGDPNFVDETDYMGPSKFKLIDTNTYTTQSASPVNILSQVFVANELQVRGAGFVLKLYGDVTGTANTKTIVVAITGATLLTATIAATTTDYIIEVELTNRTAANNLQYATRIFQNGVLPVINVAGSATVNLTASATLTVTHQVTNVADANNIKRMLLEVVH